MSVVDAEPSAPAAQPRSSAEARIAGYDVARSLAILGMIVVHFATVMSIENWKPAWLAHVVDFLDGRAAATFVVLAGAGLSLRTRKVVASGDREALARARAIIVKRGLFLLAVGLLNLAIWSGDILRVYGVSFLIAVWLLDVSDRRLWAVALAFLAGFLVLFALFDYSDRWNWETLHYRGLWTPEGLVRNLFYDGFRSVFPWTGLMIAGMWVGRRDVRDGRVRMRLALGGLALMAAAELVSLALVVYLRAHPHGIDGETIVYLVGTKSMPPLPLFLASAGGFAVLVIALSLAAAAAAPGSFPIRALGATGRLAFTWYVGHILIGLGTVVHLELIATEPLTRSVPCGLGFFAAAVAISMLWERSHRYGPLEWLMRKVAGG